MSFNLPRLLTKNLDLPSNPPLPNFNRFPQARSSFSSHQQPVLRQPLRSNVHRKHLLGPAKSQPTYFLPPAKVPKELKETKKTSDQSAQLHLDTSAGSLQASQLPSMHTEISAFFKPQAAATASSKLPTSLQIHALRFSKQTLPPMLNFRGPAVAPSVDL
ncbi:hypothetical protein M758_UG209400 [Ceratodon purpureus]|nr:hypothetical protein M758_UG209400 [Ceratodon purpureus]